MFMKSAQNSICVPLKISGTKPAYDKSGKFIGWNLFVEFSGCVLNHDLPVARGGKWVLSEHNGQKKTVATYFFEEGFLKKSYKRMCRFQSKMFAQIKQNENIK